MKVVSVIGARLQFIKAAPMISGLYATGPMDDLQRMMSLEQIGVDRNRRRRSHQRP